MAERFYANCTLELGPVVLSGPEAHHLSAVCRLGPGDPVYLFNGDGRQYRAEIVSADRRQATLQVLAIDNPPRELGFRLEVAAPLPKGDRGQFLVEKLTELGVTTFVPLKTERSVVHPSHTRVDKLQRHVIEASKQCGRNALLEVQPLADWRDYCRRPELPEQKRLAHFGGTALRGRVGEPTAVAVGPEGGFTDAEVNAAMESGWQLVDLGPRVLRIETAALVMAVRAIA